MKRRLGRWKGGRGGGQESTTEQGRAVERRDGDGLYGCTFATTARATAATLLLQNNSVTHLHRIDLLSMPLGLLSRSNHLDT